MPSMTPHMLGFLLMASVVSPAAHAQSLFEAARRAAERALERQATKVTEDAIDKVIACAVGDVACEEQAKAAGREVQGGGTAGTATARSGSGAADTQAWANYDFVPGERVIFAEDFSAERPGNFPRRLTFGAGTLEVVEYQGARYLRATSDGRFEIGLPEVLPERFTMEFDAYLPHNWHQLYVGFNEPRDGWNSVRAAYMQFDGYEDGYVQLSQTGKSGVRRGKAASAVADAAAIHQRVMPVRIHVDGDYAKVYVAERRIANIPNAQFKRSRRIGIVMAGEVAESRPMFIGNIRIAAGGRGIYETLMEKGSVALQGILFDTGSDRLRPESLPTLKEIADVMRRDGALKLRVEGHTDDVGDDLANLRLSEARARAVVTHLAKEENVDMNRLQHEGLGETTPIADNKTPEGRQTNRRVQLVRV